MLPDGTGRAARKRRRYPCAVARRQSFQGTLERKHPGRRAESTLRCSRWQAERVRERVKNILRSRRRGPRDVFRGSGRKCGCRTARDLWMLRFARAWQVGRALIGAWSGFEQRETSRT
jgi:hypothetical protein